MNEELKNIEYDEKFERKVSHAVSLVERDQIRSFIDGLESSYQAQQASPQAPVRRLYSKKWLMMAASLLLFAAAYMTFRSISSPSPAQIAEQWYTPYPNTYRPITRGEPKLVEDVDVALAKYEAEEYATALKLLSALPDQNQYILLMKGISAFEVGDYKIAKASLQQVIDEKGKQWRAAQWYMGLILLKEGFIEKAKEYLEVLAEQPTDSSYQKEATEVLGAL